MRLTILVVLATLMALSPRVAAQSRFEVVPSLSVAGVYDDNLNAQVEGSAGKMLQFKFVIQNPVYISMNSNI